MLRASVSQDSLGSQIMPSPQAVVAGWCEGVPDHPDLIQRDGRILPSPERSENIPKREASRWFVLLLLCVRHVDKVIDGPSKLTSARAS